MISNNNNYCIILKVICLIPFVTLHVAFVKLAVWKTTHFPKFTKKINKPWQQTLRMFDGSFIISVQPFQQKKSHSDDCFSGTTTVPKVLSNKTYSFHNPSTVRILCMAHTHPSPKLSLTTCPPNSLLCKDCGNRMFYWTIHNSKMRGALSSEKYG